MITPVEDEMRAQMFKTMVALEKMAAAVTDHLTADKAEGPAQSDEPAGPKQDRQTAMLIDDDVVIKGNLVVEGNIEAKKDLTTYGCVTSVEASYEDSSKLDELGSVVAKHHQALGLLATFGTMKDGPNLGTSPIKALANLLGLKACEDCVGTGWIARDETCKTCKRAGYIKV